MREDETSLFFCILLDLSSNLGNKLNIIAQNNYSDGNKSTTYTFSKAYKHCLLVCNSAHNNTTTKIQVSATCELSQLINKNYTPFSVNSIVQIYELKNVANGDTITFSYNPGIYYVILEV